MIFSNMKPRVPGAHTTHTGQLGKVGDRVGQSMTFFFNFKILCIYLGEEREKERREASIGCP